VALTVQVPVVSSVTVAGLGPLVAQTAGVSDENVTGRPDDAVALIAIGDWSRVLLDGPENEIVWFTLEMRKLRLTEGAGLKLALPA
jgi:hypothetical protein